MPEAWQFAPPSEADFEPLLTLRIEVMREHLERVFRYEPSRARRVFRESFDEPGLKISGSFKAAQALYADVTQINSADLKRWLHKAETIQWDYKNIVKRRGVLERLK